MVSPPPDMDYNRTHIISTAATQGGLDEQGAGLGGVMAGGLQDQFDVRVAYHLPEAIGAQQKDVVGAQGDSEGICLHGGALAQTAVDFVAPGVRVDILAIDLLLLYKTRHDGWSRVTWKSPSPRR